MKNILLATTALVMTAGFASAEVTFSGTAEGGVTRTAKTDAVYPHTIGRTIVPYALATCTEQRIVANSFDNCSTSTTLPLLASLTADDLQPLV